MIPELPPALFLMAGGVLAAVLPGRLRLAAVLAAPVAAMIVLIGLTPESAVHYDVAGATLTLLKVDALRRLFGIIFILITFIGSIYALHIRNPGEHVAALFYSAGAVGVTFAGDWLTLFVFWELMAAASVFLVWYRRTPAATRSGMRYFLVHTAGGGLLLAGILLYLADGGSFEVVAIVDHQGPAFWLMLAGVCLNAAVPPLGAWLPDAYAQGTVTGSVFLSAFTTKTAVFVLLAVFPGTRVLIGAGVFMALYGVVFAVLENDIRRLLAYHIISQVGYMVAAVGIGTEMAVNGGAAHAFSHILYKSLLFMGAGAVLFATGRSKLTELGGIAKKMPLVVILYAVGAVSISGFPLWNGFISKSMIISAAAEPEVHLSWAELGLLLASVGTFLHTGLKLLYFTFLGPDKNITVKPIPRNMLVAMGLGALGCTFFGVYPTLLYGWLPFAETAAEYHPYTADHVIASCQLLLATFLGFYWLIPKLGGEQTITIDTDWPYRRFVPSLVAGAQTVIDRLSVTTLDVARAFRSLFMDATRNPVRRSRILRDTLPVEREQGLAYDENADRLPISVTVGAALFIFGLMAIVYWLAS